MGFGNIMSAQTTRRHFLIGVASVSGGLAIGVRLASENSAHAQTQSALNSIPFNAWAKLSTDGTVTVIICQSEMGQGIATGLAQLVAEELDADWSKVVVEMAPADPIYRNTYLVKEALTGGYENFEPGMAAAAKEALLDFIARHIGQQVTGGSTSMRWLYQPMRQAGATMRMMLVQAAAMRWQVPTAQCTTDRGYVVHVASKRRLAYGDLVESAAGREPPEQVSLKSPKDFRLIGQSVPRLDIPAKVLGRAEFGIDIRRPNQVFAVITFAPTLGGKLQSVDDSTAKSMQGVIDVVAMDDAVVTIADTTWHARQAANALTISWDAGSNKNLNSLDVEQRMQASLSDDGKVAEEIGQPAEELARHNKYIEANYAVPYLAHATLEPMNCTVEITEAGVDIWTPTQAQETMAKVAAKIAKISDSKVRIHTTYLGGGFGRRAEVDMAAYAVRAAIAVRRPVQLLYSREEDMARDYYRPMAVAQLQAAVDESGLPRAWTHRIVSPSILSRVAPPVTWTGLDPTSVEGATKMPYAIPHRRIDYVLNKTPIPVGFWRSVGHSQNAFFKECFLDEVAEAGKLDPYVLRRTLLRDKPHHLFVLDQVAKMIDWSKPLPYRSGHGIALHESFGSIVACALQVAVSAKGELKIERAAMAVNCGRTINPNAVEAQMQGSLVFGLTAALYGEITVHGGQIEQKNFPDYPLLSLDQTPPIEVHIVPSESPPAGVGEPGVPPVAPALANAIFSAIGIRIRRLPIARHSLAA